MLTLQRLLHKYIHEWIHVSFTKTPDGLTPQYDHKDSGIKIMADWQHLFLFCLLLSLKLLVSLSSIYHQGFNNCQAKWKEQCQSTCLSITFPPPFKYTNKTSVHIMNFRWGLSSPVNAMLTGSKIGNITHKHQKQHMKVYKGLFNSKI